MSDARPEDSSSYSLLSWIGLGARKKRSLSAFRRWEKLESERMYDFKIIGFRTAFWFKNTGFADLPQNRDFRIFICIHLVIKFFYIVGVIPKDAVEKTSYWYIGWKPPLQIITLLMVFFLAFFSRLTFSTYMQLHKQTVKLIRSVIKLTFLIHLHVGRAAPKFEYLASRYLLASLIVFYEMMWNEQEKVEGFLTNQVLTEDERDYLIYFERHQRPILLVQWCQDVLREGFKIAQEPHNPIKPGNADLKFMLERLVKVLQWQQEVSDNRAMPVPFHYYHLLCFMLVSNLMFWAYSMGLSDTWSATATYVICVAIFMVGIQVALQLEDPFGTDAVDFPLEHWLVRCWGIVRRIQFTKFLDDEVSRLAQQEEVWELPDSVIPFKDEDYYLSFEDFLPDGDFEKFEIREDDEGEEVAISFMPEGYMPVNQGGLRQEKVSSHARTERASSRARIAALKAARDRIAAGIASLFAPRGKITKKASEAKWRVAKAETPKEPEQRPLLGDNVSETSSLQPRASAPTDDQAFQHPMLAFGSSWGASDGMIQDILSRPADSDPRMHSQEERHRESIHGISQTTETARKGSKEIQLADYSGLAVGDPIHIESSAGKEFNIIKGFSSILLDHPLRFTHPMGATVRKLEPDDPLLDPLYQVGGKSDSSQKMASTSSQIAARQRTMAGGGAAEDAGPTEDPTTGEPERAPDRRPLPHTQPPPDTQPLPATQEGAAARPAMGRQVSPAESLAELRSKAPPKAQRTAERKGLGELGLYKVIAAQGAHITAGKEKGSEHLQLLGIDSVVDVVEVKWMKEELRIRGRLTKPVPGWISLAKTDRSLIWARPVQEGEETGGIVAEADKARMRREAANEELAGRESSASSGAARSGPPGSQQPHDSAEHHAEGPDDKAYFAACRCSGRTLLIHREVDQRKLHMRLPNPEFEVCVIVSVDEPGSANPSPKVVSAGGLVAGWPGNSEPWSKFDHSKQPTELKNARETWLRLSYPFKREGLTAEIPPKVEGEIKVRISFSFFHSVTISLHFSLECLFEHIIPEGIFFHEDKMVLVEHLLGENTKLDEIHEDYIEDVIKYAFPDIDEDKQHRLIHAWQRHLTL